MSNLPLARYLQDLFSAILKRIDLLSADLTDQQLLGLATYDSSIAQTLGYADNLDKLMSNLADRMTDVFRNFYSTVSLTLAVSAKSSPLGHVE